MSLAIYVPNLLDSITHKKTIRVKNFRREGTLKKIVHIYAFKQVGNK